MDIDYSNYDEVYSMVEQGIGRLYDHNSVQLDPAILKMVADGMVDSPMPVTKIKLSKQKGTFSPYMIKLNAKSTGVDFTIHENFFTAIDQSTLSRSEKINDDWKIAFVNRQIKDNKLGDNLRAGLERMSVYLVADEEEMPEDLYTEVQYNGFLDDILAKIGNKARAASSQYRKIYGWDIEERIAGVDFYDDVTTAMAQCRKSDGKDKHGKLLFQRLLLKIPIDVGESVIYHELAHLYHMNHYQEFYRLLHSWMPDYDKKIDEADAIYTRIRSLRKRGKSML